MASPAHFLVCWATSQFIDSPRKDNEMGLATICCPGNFRAFIIGPSFDIDKLCRLLGYFRRNKW